MELKDYLQSNNIKQILVYKTKSILNISNLLTPRVLSSVVEDIDGMIVLLKSKCIGQVEFEDEIEKKYKNIDHFIFHRTLIAAITKDQQALRIDDWSVFESKYRKYFYKFDDSIECQVYSDYNGNYIEARDGTKIDIVRSVKFINASSEERTDETLNKMISNNNYYKKEISDCIKQISYIANSISYDKKSQQFVLKYGKNKADIINQLNKINKLLSNI